mgnify:CR=1 FL=1
MVKFIIVALLLAIIISLFSGLFFLVKDQSKSSRTANALTVRVTLAIILIIVVAYAVQTGQLPLNPSPINAF